MKRIIAIACGLYVGAIALAAALTGQALIEPALGYRLSVLWLNPETLEHRLVALEANGRMVEAALYLASHQASVGVIVALSVYAFARPFLGPAEPICQVRSTALVMGSLLFLIVLAKLTQPILDVASDIPSASTALSSMPAYWYLGMVVSAAILAAHMALALHDVGLYLKTRWFEPIPQARPVEAAAPAPWDMGAPTPR